jgi:MYXO-CTERM domain-containing protein
MSHSMLRSGLLDGWKYPVVIALALASFSLLPSVAGAQGRCSCNRGCHQYPGQCVQPGSSGCEAGFAPFCGTRADSCPNAGWVSCGGDCTCVRVSPLDAGVADAGASDSAVSDGGTAGSDRPDGGASLDVVAPPDAPTALDVSSPMDTPATADAVSRADTVATTDDRVAMDSPPGADVATMLDAPGRDAPTSDASALDGSRPASDVSSSSPETSVPADAPIGLDAMTSVDGPATMDGPGPVADAPSTADGGCVCPGGACVGGVCYRDRCTYLPELGFICTLPGTTCRLIGKEPLCIPVCAGVTCSVGEFCDDRSEGRCVVDRCASIQCAAGTVCRHNQCGRWNGVDGGTFDFKDAAVESDAGATAPVTATDTGCGCRAGGVGERKRGGAFAALMLGLVGLLRRRSRTERK